MKKLLIAGASGGLGLEILKQLSKEEYRIRALIRDPKKKDLVAPYCHEIFLGDATQPTAIKEVCSGIDIVFSSIGKSVSLFTQETHSFYEIDYLANMNLLYEAKASGVKRFVYVSVFGSEHFEKLAMCRSKELFTREIAQTGLDYTIIKPVGLFSGLHDLVIMGKNGILVTPGDGTPVTNPIHQQDLATVCIDHLEQGPEIVEVGGPEIHSRNQVARMVARLTQCKIKFNQPLWMIHPGLGVIRLANKNLYDKLSQLNYVSTHNMVAPAYGSLKLEDYLLRVHRKI